MPAVPPYIAHSRGTRRQASNGVTSWAKPWIVAPPASRAGAFCYDGARCRGDIVARICSARREIARGIAFPAGAEELGLSSAYVYAQVLHALWDSGFYEYVREHPRFSRARVVEELGLDPMTFDWLMYYLVGRGVVRAAGEGELELTEKGAARAPTPSRAGC